MEAGKTTEPHELIIISSSSSSGEDSPEESETEASVCSPEFSAEEINSSSCSGGDESDGDEGETEVKDEDSMSRRVVHLLNERYDIDDLSLVECKAYLRRHGLRLSGTRAECVQRIKDHWRIKDGLGEILYPKSSFTIDCTGDACKGDVVMFRQKVFRKSGGILGKRTVAGRIVRESYGAAKQQHTFTVEVLWSRGVQELPPLSRLLVKGRKLYKMQTFRQKWNHESERRQVLSEKHVRGAAARQIREMRRTRGVDHKRKRSSINEGRSVSKHQKRSVYPTDLKQQMRKQRSNSYSLQPDRQLDSTEKGIYSPPAHQSRRHNYHPPIYQSHRYHLQERPYSMSSSAHQHDGHHDMHANHGYNFTPSHRYHQERTHASHSHPHSMSSSAHHNDDHHDMHHNHGYNFTPSHRYQQERRYASHSYPHSMSSSAHQNGGHYNRHTDQGYQPYAPQRDGSRSFGPGVSFPPIPYVGRRER